MVCETRSCIDLHWSHNLFPSFLFHFPSFPSKTREGHTPEAAHLLCMQKILSCQHLQERQEKPPAWNLEGVVKHTSNGLLGLDRRSTLQGTHRCMCAQMNTHRNTEVKTDKEQKKDFDSLKILTKVLHFPGHTAKQGTSCLGKPLLWEAWCMSHTENRSLI